MKRNIVTLSLCIMLLSVLLVSIAGAHPVSLTDKSRLDWFGKGASNKNIGLIARNTASQGEFVWADAQNDQRIISPPNSNLVREADLDHFSVTADPNNIYFLAKMERITSTGLNPLPELIVTIDTDHQTNAGQLALPDSEAGARCVLALYCFGRLRWAPAAERCRSLGPRRSDQLGAHHPR